MKPATRRFFGGTLVLLSGLVSGNIPCRDAYAQNGGQPTSKPQAAYRLTMTECEGIDNCTTWSFLSSNGWKGYGKWRTGEEAVLDLRSAENGKVIIERTDVTGAKEGLTATYNGILRDGKVGGEYESHYRGHDSSGNWYAILGPAASSLPTEMHFCGANCMTLLLDNGRYFARDGLTDAKDCSEATCGTWTVESFTPDSVILHRHDPYSPYNKFSRPGIGWNVVVAGRMSPDGNSITNATVDGHPATFKLAWGSALSSVFGSNAQRDAAGGLQPSPPAQVTPADVYADAKVLRDGALELKKWNDFFQIFQSRDDH
jgi:hypothetical protein